MTITVHVVLGLLGSGKTTLLQHLLEAPVPGPRPAVLVGEYAEVGFDAEMLGDGHVVQIAGRGPDAGAAYAEPLRALVERAGADRILVEASGVADAARLLAALDADPALAARVTWGRTVTVIDAGAFERLAAVFAPALEAQVAAADLVVVNKRDRLPDDAARAALDARLRRLAPTAEIAFAYMGQVPPALVFRPRPGGRLPAALRAAPAADFESFVYRSDRVCYDRARFGHRLLNPVAGRLARVKGVVRGYDGTWIVNGLPGQLDWTPAPAPRATALAFIGAGMAAARDAIHADLDRTLEELAAAR